MKGLGEKQQAIIYALLCVFSWSFLPVISKLVKSSLNNFQFLFWSNLLSLFVIIASLFLVKRTKGLFKYSFKEIFKISIIGMLGTCFYYLCLYWGYHNAQGIQVLVIQYTWPILIVILSFIILKEKMSMNKIISCLLGFLGVIIILTKGDILSFQIPNGEVFLVVLIGSLAFALFSVLSKKIKIDDYHSVFYFFVSGTFFSFVSMLLFSKLSLPSPAGLPHILINGALINGVTYILWIKALKLTESSLIAPLVFISPVLSTLWLVIFLGEAFLPIYVLGIGMSVVSGLMTK